MKKLLLLMLALMTASMGFAQENSCKVVVDKDGGVMGRYVRETQTAYIANPLDWEVE